MRKSKELDFFQRKSRDQRELDLLYRRGGSGDRWLFHEAGLFIKEKPGVSGQPKECGSMGQGELFGPGTLGGLGGSAWASGTRDNLVGRLGSS